jgi:hypothetical protein
MGRVMMWLCQYSWHNQAPGRFQVRPEPEARLGLNTDSVEPFREPQQFGPHVKPRRLMDVLQLDMRAVGFLKCGVVLVMMTG